MISQANVMSHVMPVVALLAGQPSFLDTLEKAIRVTQNNADAVGMPGDIAQVP